MKPSLTTHHALVLTQPRRMLWEGHVIHSILLDWSVVYQMAFSGGPGLSRRCCRGKSGDQGEMLYLPSSLLKQWHHYSWFYGLGFLNTTFGKKCSMNTSVQTSELNHSYSPLKPWHAIIESHRDRKRKKRRYNFMIKHVGSGADQHGANHSTSYISSLVKWAWEKDEPYGIAIFINKKWSNVRNSIWINSIFISKS